jgi:hypothetical protein
MFLSRKVPSKRRCQKQNVNKNCLGPKQLKEMKNHNLEEKIATLIDDRKKVFLIILFYTKLNNLHFAC